MYVDSKQLPQAGYKKPTPYDRGRKNKNKLPVIIKKHMDKKSYCRVWTTLTVTGIT
jgi:hypothetical protein